MTCMYLLQSEQNQEPRVDFVQTLVFDSLNSRLLVSDTLNHQIRIVSTTGVVSKLAGSGVVGFVDGSSALAAFNKPLGVVVAPDSSIYVADSLNMRIRKIGIVASF